MGAREQRSSTYFRRQCLKAYLAFREGTTGWRETAEICDTPPKSDAARTQDTLRLPRLHSA